MYLKIHISKYNLDLDMLIEYCEKFLQLDDISFINKNEFMETSHNLHEYSSWFYFKFQNNGLIIMVDCTKTDTEDDIIIYSLIKDIRKFLIDFIRNEKLLYVETL